MSSILAHWWPIGMILVAHVVYQISAKSIPAAMDPFAAVFFLRISDHTPLAIAAKFRTGRGVASRLSY